MEYIIYHVADQQTHESLKVGCARAGRFLRRCLENKRALDMNIRVEILETVDGTPSDAGKRERFWHKEFGFRHGYHYESAASSAAAHRPHTIEEIERIRASSTGRKRTAEQRALYSERMYLRWGEISEDEKKERIRKLSAAAVAKLTPESIAAQKAGQRRAFDERKARGGITDEQCARYVAAHARRRANKNAGGN